jgi:beta-lactamase class A
MKRLLACALLLFCLGTAATMTEPEAVRIVMTATPVPIDLFSQSFLAQIPGSQLTPIRDQVVAPLGTFERVDGSNGRYVAHFTHGELTVNIHLDTQGKIDFLQLLNPTIAGGSIDDARKMLEALPGNVGYLVLRDGREVAARNAGEAYGVGSTFKLAVLSALRKQIDAGKRKWSDVVRLRPQWKSLPSGVLQTWPDDTPITLATLATQMISISDNTAADSLIHVVGQDALAPFAARNTPFMTTREMFTLKSKGNEALRLRFRSGNVQQRRAVLAEIDRQPLPDAAALDMNPQLSDIEWHFSSRDLCRLMQYVHDLPLMSVNPGVASPSQWKRIAYKGGSDSGVISMTTWLEGNDGATYCVTATWNDRDDAVQEAKFAAAYGSLVGALTHG